MYEPCTFQEKECSRHGNGNSRISLDLVARSILGSLCLFLDQQSLRTTEELHGSKELSEKAELDHGNVNEWGQVELEVSKINTRKPFALGSISGRSEMDK